MAQITQEQKRMNADLQAPSAGVKFFDLKYIITLDPNRVGCLIISDIKSQVFKISHHIELLKAHLDTVFETNPTFRASIRYLKPFWS